MDDHGRMNSHHLEIVHLVTELPGEVINSCLSMGTPVSSIPGSVVVISTAQDVFGKNNASQSIQVQQQDIIAAINNFTCLGSSVQQVRKTLAESAGPSTLLTLLRSSNQETLHIPQPAPKRCCIEGCNARGVTTIPRHRTDLQANPGWQASITNRDSMLWYCNAHTKTCKVQGCSELWAGRKGFILCKDHRHRGYCQEPSCSTVVRGRQFCRKHSVQICMHEGCEFKALKGDTSISEVAMYCALHGGGQRCLVETCHHLAASNGPAPYCVSHGGGRRCQVDGCNRAAARTGDRLYCTLHGGGKRCMVQSCQRLARVGHLCIAHSGRQRCQMDGCDRLARKQGVCQRHGGGSGVCELCTSKVVSGGRCAQHGGGKRCSVPGCESRAQLHGYCRQHGGKRKCIVEDCLKQDAGQGTCKQHRGHQLM